MTIDYWLKNSQDKYKTANSLFKSKRWADCLFFCHLSIESLLKAFVIKRTKKQAPYIHDLERLAEIAELTLDDIKRNNLRNITHFNLESRYPEIKFIFYKKVDKKFAEKYLNISKNIIIWLKKEMQK
ncbi:MAG: HEPN domain-containing protein [Patescibacteria group bacterium]